MKTNGVYESPPNRLLPFRKKEDDSELELREAIKLYTLEKKAKSNLLDSLDDTLNRRRRFRKEHPEASKESALRVVQSVNNGDIAGLKRALNEG